MRVPTKAPQLIRVDWQDITDPLRPSHSLTLKGRQAWLMVALDAAGKRGISKADTPAIAMQDYVFKVRSKADHNGLKIRTEWHEHGGPYKGRHARYVLDTPVTITPLSGTVDTRAQPDAQLA